MTLPYFADIMPEIYLTFFILSDNDFKAANKRMECNKYLKE
jgi:hypothetical protein